MRITAKDCVLNAVNLWREVLDILVSVLLIIHQGLVNDIPAVAKHVVEDQENHQGQREQQKGQQDDDDNQGNKNSYHSFLFMQ